ncbi:glycosyltransferase [Pusillimonas sp. T7-7]|uniref:glycosyltransferase n=1 Tax=Pusillimonas sp. (strain T7-7) TaxID=1007105 RepID=UPI0005A05CC1|nr:glycosyltransferase [Pusillimonas sp. T7-7]
MKILITDIHHGNGGGHVTYIMSLLNSLKNVHDITLAVPECSRLFRYASRIQGIRLLPTVYTCRVHALTTEVLRLRKYLARERFDVVHVNASADHRHVMLACLGLAQRPKIVWTKHNLNRVNSIGHRLRARWGTDAVVAVSGYVGRMLAESDYGKKPVHVIPHGIDTTYFYPVTAGRKQALRARLLGEVADDAVVLGSAGGTDFEKGWLDLVAAVASLPPAEQARIILVVAGALPDADLRKRLDAHALKAKVIFPGLVDDIRFVLGACDIGFVLSHRESLSYACRESLSMGLPALISDAGGLPENITNGREGWIVPVQNINAIARVLRNILECPECLPAMSAAARLHSEQNFNLDEFIQATQAIYQSVIPAPLPRTIPI